VQQIVDFILELDKLKSVTRKVRPHGLARYENTAELSWQIVMLALPLGALRARTHQHRSRDQDAPGARHR